MTTVAVLGATSGIAEACLRQWAESGAALVLVGRDAAGLQAISADLTARGAASVASAVIDLGSVEGVERAVDFVASHGPVDSVLIAFGVMPEQAQADQSVESASSILEVTGALNALALHLTTLRLIEQGAGTVAILGSVAGDRGRKANYLYGAAKSMVATTAAGLQHRVAGTDVCVVLVKPGPTRTAMTDHLDGADKMATPEQVARDILVAIDRRTPVVYTPSKWRLIMFVVRNLPRRIFHRTNF